MIFLIQFLNCPLNNLDPVWVPSLDAAAKLHRSRGGHRLIPKLLPKLFAKFVPRPPDVYCPSQFGNDDDQGAFRKLDSWASSSTIAKSWKIVAIWVSSQRFLVGWIAGFKPTCRVEQESVRICFLIHEDRSSRISGIEYVNA